MRKISEHKNHSLTTEKCMVIKKWFVSVNYCSVKYLLRLTVTEKRGFFSFKYKVIACITIIDFLYNCILLGKLLFMLDAKIRCNIHITGYRKGTKLHKPLVFYYIEGTK